MEITNLATIISLKKELSIAIEKNHYNLLSPEVISLSQKLDLLMTPLFKYQLDETFPINYYYE